MAVSRGTQTNLVILEETTYGETPGTPAATRLGYIDYQVESSRALIQPDTITATRERSRPSQDNVDVTGPINYELAAEDVGALFKHLIGTPVTSGSDPYTHTFTPTDLPIGMEFELDNGPVLAGTNRYATARGCKIASADFSFTTSGYATATFNIVGRDVIYSATESDASPLSPGHISMPMGVAVIEEGGTVLAHASDISLTINNNIETDVRGISPGGLRIDAPESFVDVSGSLTALLVDDTLLNKSSQSTPSDLKITLELGSGDGSQDNGHIELFIGKLIYSQTSPTVTGPGSRTLNLDFQGYLDGATNSIRATVKNHLPDVTK